MADPVLLSQQRFLRNVRGGRRGAAPGPSGCTAEHLRVFRDDEDSADLLMWAAGQIANAALPPPVLAGIRLGRIVALQKPDGGVRGLVMSDAFRRVVPMGTPKAVGRRFATPHLWPQLGTAGGRGASGAGIHPGLTKVRGDPSILRNCACDSIDAVTCTTGRREHVQIIQEGRKAVARTQALRSSS